MKKYYWAAVSALLVLSAASAAVAQTHAYNFTGSFRFGSGAVTGTFTYNQTTNTYTAVSVSTEAGTGPSAAAPAQTYTVVRPGGFVDDVYFLAGPVKTGQKFFLVSFNPVLNATSPAISDWLEGTCDDPLCDNAFSYNRQGYVAGTFSRTLVVPPAPIPTLSEWAMILFGVLLAGSAALYIQRGQQFGRKFS